MHTKDDLLYPFILQLRELRDRETEKNVLNLKRSLSKLDDTKQWVII